jgi:monoterpene epsilon-lactone hydrolase
MTHWCPEAELHIWQGMAHVFPANLALVWAAREALDITGSFLRRHLAR